MSKHLGVPEKKQEVSAMNIIWAQQRVTQPPMIANANFIGLPIASVWRSSNAFNLAGSTSTLFLPLKRETVISAILKDFTN